MEENKYCCKTFEENKEIFGWFNLKTEGKLEYLMPHILNTKIRLNYCPCCGKEIRNFVIDAENFNS